MICFYSFQWSITQSTFTPIKSESELDLECRTILTNKNESIDLKLSSASSSDDVRVSFKMHYLVYIHHYWSNYKISGMFIKAKHLNAWDWLVMQTLVKSFCRCINSWCIQFKNPQPVVLALQSGVVISVVVNVGSGW